MEVIYSCRRDCCPEMFFDDEKDCVVIKDDFGGSVSLTRFQFETLCDAYSARFVKDVSDA